jgi:hypothetical protein
MTDKDKIAALEARVAELERAANAPRLFIKRGVNSPAADVLMFNYAHQQSSQCDGRAEAAASVSPPD